MQFLLLYIIDIFESRMHHQDYYVLVVDPDSEINCTHKAPMSDFCAKNLKSEHFQYWLFNSDYCNDDCV